MKLRKYMCVILLSLGAAAGCSASPDLQGVPSSISPEDVCISVIKSAKVGDVLIGTDIVPFSTIVPMRAMIADRYHMEMGGAISSLTLFKENHLWQLRRKFNEPGLITSEKNYLISCIDDQGFQGPGITGIVTNDGLLVWEEHSEIEGIPGDLWILYSVSK